MRALTKRHARVKQMLLDRRRELQDHVQSRIRARRAERPRQGGDDLEHSDADNQGDMDLALIQMRAETLMRIDSALKRLEAGHYGACADCGKEIAEPRLRALPFAVRCQACEEQRETRHGDARQLAVRSGPSLFTDAISS